MESDLASSVHGHELTWFLHSLALLFTQFWLSANCASYFADEPCRNGRFLPGRTHCRPFARQRVHCSVS